MPTAVLNSEKKKTRQMNIIDDNNLNLHNSFLNNDNTYTKVTVQSKLIGGNR